MTSESPRVRTEEDHQLVRDAEAEAEAPKEAFGEEMFGSRYV